MKLNEIADEFKNSKLDYHNRDEVLKFLQTKLGSLNHKYEVNRRNRMRARDQNLPNRMQTLGDASTAIERKITWIEQLIKMINDKGIDHEDTQWVLDHRVRYPLIFRENDEFTNTKFDSPRAMMVHLYNRQKARCHAIDLYMSKLIRKYSHSDNLKTSESWRGSWAKSMAGTTSQSFMTGLTSLEHFFNTAGASPEEVEKLQTLYIRAKHAKEAFESAGGEYRAYEAK